jgi:hypothetical protein
VKEKKKGRGVHLFSFIKKQPTNNKKNGIKGGGEERGSIRLQFFRFFGGWVWSEGKKKGRGVHLFLFIKKQPTNNKKNGIKGGEEERGSIRLQIFRFFGGWVWSKGKKKRQARANCVRPSGAPTSK